MKKLLTFVLLALLTIGASAQDKKTWDFSKGWSDETLANLEAGSEWSQDGTSWKETGQFGSGAFVANGVPIKELVGLERSSAGLSKNNNYLLTPATFRLNRNNQELIFPSLKNGQKLTIVGRSANATAANRGVKGKYDYMVRVDDDKENNLMLGNQVEGSKGTYTFVYEIQTSETGEVPVAIQMITGGIDFTLFMIDEGDVAQTAKIAYLHSGDATNDAALLMLQARENTEVTTIDVSSATVTAAELQEYALTVIAPSVPADNAAVAVVKEALPFTPTLNMNANLYPAWGYGEAVTPEAPLGIVIDNKSKLLTGVELQEDPDTNTQFVEFGDVIQAVQLGAYFEGDATPLVVYTESEDKPAVAHLHNISHNGYVYMPDAAVSTGIFNNAVELLVESKSDITATAAPKITQNYKDMYTMVSIAAGMATQPKVQFFYTTDGNEPTTESTPYTEPVKIDKACTFKAAALAEGYTLSDVVSADINIFSQPASPAIAYDIAESKTTITLTCETEGVDIWYNFEAEATTDTLKSTKYTEPFVITAPQTVNAFAVAGGMVFSEPAAQRVVVKDARVVIDVAAHFSAQQWTTDNNPAGLSVANGKGMFSWGASAATMYTGEGTTETVTDPETGDEMTVTHYTDADLREIEVVNEPGENPEWVLKSRGTCLIWQNLGAQTTNFGDDSNYNPMYSTDVDPLFPITKYDIQFYKFQAGEPGNGSIESIKSYQAPLDVVVLANMQGGPLLVQVSADGTEWTTIGEIAKTGKSRMWSKYTFSYDGTDEVFVRVTQEEVSGGAKVFDIYVANAGEKSAEKKAEYDKEYEDAAPSVSGDVNGDGKIDVEDVVGIVNKILGEPAEGFIEAAADVTGDGKIDVDDVVAVVNIILNANGSAAAPKMMNILLQNGFRF